MTPGAVGGAVLSIVGEAAAISQFNEQTKALADKQIELGNRIFDLANTIAEDKADAMTLTLTATQIGGFNDQIKNLLASIESVLEQMTDWKNDLALLSDFSQPPRAQFYTDQVTNGTAYWLKFQSQLMRYVNILSLSVTNPGE